MRRALLLLMIAVLPAAAPSLYEPLKQRGEASYAEKSFARAHEAYVEASRLQLPPEEKRWVTMRLADTRWRSAPDKRDEARKALDAFVRDSDENHDRAWAEANESLGDLYWLAEQNLAQATPFYLSALDWWASSDDLTLARRRYLAIVFRMSEPQQVYARHRQDITFGVPREVLVNAVSIAETAEDRAHARFILARTLIADSSPESVERGMELFDQIIAEGKPTTWYDDALFAEAMRLNQGAVVVGDDGELAYKPDHLKALELFRRLVREFRAGETPYYVEATNAIHEIEAPSIAVMVAGTLLPASEQEFVLSWRNVKSVNLTITPIDLTDDVPEDVDPSAWSRRAGSGQQAIRQWVFTTSDRGDHVRGDDRIRVTPKLPPGAYMIGAAGGGDRALQLMLVTDANIIAHSNGPRSDIFVCDAITGRPIGGARIRVWRKIVPQYKFISREAQADANGLASVTFSELVDPMAVIACSAPNGRQAWLTTGSYGYGYGSDRTEWKVYAFTDRPAYRPGETVRWKMIARARQRNEWVTPANDTIDYEIASPRGEKITSGTAKLSEFGSFWADLPLTAAMPLGAYAIRFTKSSSGMRGYDQVGYAMLFRLEEYKLPEFRVTVTTPEKMQYRSGETVEVTIDASYYFGGPVANANVEAIVYSHPLVRYWYPWHEYPWYYQHREYGYYNSEVKKETLRTDATGRAILRVETSADAADTVFQIEARVTDASRREVAGSGVVNVTRQRYAVIARPAHYLLRPGEKASFEFRAVDANDQPVQVTGTVNVVRQRWTAIESVFRYADQDVITTTVTTNAKGEAAFTFTAPQEGYYTIRWTSEDRTPGRPLRARDLVKAETAVWVTDRATLDPGYHASGLEIILDKDHLRAGETAMAMVVTPASGRSVLLTTSADGILDSQVLRLDGTVKLVQIPLDDRHTPVFFLTASSVFDRQLSTVSQNVVVPPVEHFINVEVKPDRDEYEPRQKGAVIITTRDVDGKPVRAEVALGVSDESVSAIQKDTAADPRQFFFGRLRGNAVTPAASVVAQQYINYVVEKDGRLIDDRLRDIEKLRAAVAKKDDEEMKTGIGSGVVGGLAIDAAALPVNRAVSEAITVTAQVPLAVPPPPPPPGSPQSIEVHVRSDFRSTAFWQPNVITGPDGTARVSFVFPESTTTWRATARAVSASTQVGMASATTRTSMPLIVRLQAPRFFVAGDRATVSAVINNNTDAPFSVAPSIAVEGLALQSNATAASIDVPAHGESRADWVVIAEKAGDAKLRVSGRAADRADAMEKTFTVYEHGVDKLIAKSGKMRAADTAFTLDLPHARRATSLTVQLQPSLAATMLDALPYLIDYPYGCTEQTMSRFLPAAIVARTLASNGLDPGAIEQRMFGGIERTYAGKTHPKGAKDLRVLPEITSASMMRLYDFQQANGGWGWWKQGESDAFMTAYVVWGFSVAKAGGLNVDDGRVHRAVVWLDERLVRSEHQWHAQTWMLHALAAWRSAAHDGQMTADERRAYDDVYAHRDRLTSYSRALLALTAHDFGDAERAAVLVRNLEDGLKGDHWGEDRLWWHWYESPVESTAFGLQALVRIDPKNPLIDPVMTWLVKNRRGAQWNNTRDTAITILALNDYLRTSGELKGTTTFDLTVNGHVIASQRAADILGAPARFDIDDIRDANEIRIHRVGGPLYFAVEGRFVSLEDPVEATGNEMFVRRDYYRLAAKPTLLKGVAYDKLALADQGAAKSGERVEVVLTVETKNDYEYLMFEDLKPAGLEAVSLQSGTDLYAREVNGNRTVWVYQELRDRKVALFIDHLPQGTWEIRYTLRAEVPGTFHALPLLGQAMYVPEIRANSSEIRLRVNE